jgi:C1A family cysteine protease
MEAAMEYIKKTGLELESDYGYKGVDGTCKATASKEKVKVTGITEVKSNSKQGLHDAVQKGPVSVAIEADTDVFQYYSGGVLNSASCGTNLDHGVAAVGYGTANGQDYFIVRNSWGAWWGENGYVRIAAVDGAGICGIQMEPVWPTTD